MVPSVADICFYFRCKTVGNFHPLILIYVDDMLVVVEKY